MVLKVASPEAVELEGMFPKKQTNCISAILYRLGKENFHFIGPFLPQSPCSCFPSF